jgi:cellulose synthase/poly-beta-1,6-N-acetylglucosamine synthase-like glycosyltransferase
VLERIGAWDAWNVTEDADLGVRLARLGYRAKVIRSSTLEEAPNTAGQWLRQRTRWLKGYMLTWTVHMRNPVRLYRDLGFLNFIAFHAFIGGVPVSALMLPIFLGGVASDIVAGVWLLPSGGIARALPYMMDAFNLVLGFGTAMALAAIGADRRGLTRLVGWIPTVPIYWLFSSVAAWRAIWQLLTTPFLWEKTEHGLARTSQSATS